MSLNKGDYADRIADLEGVTERLRAVAGLSPARLAAASAERRVRLAVTCENPNTHRYPDPPADTFYIKFADCKYSPQDGQQSPSITPRSGQGKTLAHNIPGQYIPKGTLIAVERHNGQWWTYWCCSPGGGSGSGSGSGSGGSGSGSGSGPSGASGSGAPCTMVVGGFDLSKLPGFQAGLIQILGHDGNNCLTWYTAGDCFGSTFSGD